LPIETRLYDYELPTELIAQVPIGDRDKSRLMIVDRAGGGVTHSRFAEIVEYVRPGDLFVINDSRVIRARLFVKKKSGARIELLFLRRTDEIRKRWRALARPGRKLSAGTELFHDSLDTPFCRIIKKHDGGEWTVEVSPDPLIPFLELNGVVPLPPYIKTEISDPGRYQTIYADPAGSAAAPTAGLHFTELLMKKMEEKGARFARVTLHIGLDTFRPVSTEYLEDHQMHSETYTVPGETAAAICETVRNGGRVIAVGTTSVRSLESWAYGRTRESIAAGIPGCSGDTRLFIYQKDQIKVVDALVTNFHLPRSTLLALVSAFTGLDLVKRAYGDAIRERYRFYSFGDAMLIV
jgi:S-adenosylmethionine:tRNA ribosyltransferase-isomerase